jgi:ketosteroid isomerase-like protein
MTATGAQITDEAAIRALIDARVNAVRNKDVEAAVASVAEGALAFDVVDPLQSEGCEAARRRAENWFASFAGPIGHEIANLNIAASGDVGFGHGLAHVHANKADGSELDMWWRTTLCLLKQNGQWMITHEHNSVPFNMETGQASLGLKPNG